MTHGVWNGEAWNVLAYDGAGYEAEMSTHIKGSLSINVAMGILLGMQAHITGSISINGTMLFREFIRSTRRIIVMRDHTTVYHGGGPP